MLQGPGLMSNALRARSRNRVWIFALGTEDNSRLRCAGVQHHMGEEKPHVAAMQLWCYSSGTATLTDADFEHLLFCPQCQSLLDEFIAILDQLPSVNPNQAA